MNADEPALAEAPVDISVLMSTWDRSATLARAIESVLAQQGVTFELIIVDDHSSDETPAILARWQDDERIISVRNDKNRGLPASLNRAAKLASGRFLARIDDDDHWIDEKKLKKQLAWMEGDRKRVLLGTAYIDEQGRASTNPVGDTQIRAQMLFRCPFCHSSVLMSRAAFDSVAGYDESLPYAEDWDLWLRLGSQGVIGNLEAITLVKEPGENNMSQRFFFKQLSMAQDFLKRYGSTYPGAGRAALVHRFNRWFFRVVPLNSALHRSMSRLFRWVFQLGSSASSGKT